MRRGEKDGRNQESDVEDRRSMAPKLCEARIGRYFDHHYVRHIMRAGHVGDLVVYAKSAGDFLRETFGIENIPSKATLLEDVRLFLQMTLTALSGRVAKR